jgi:hypothetical protein
LRIAAPAPGDAPLAVTLGIVVLLAVAAGLAWWVVRRAAQYRREAESRESRALEALFAARHAADGGANIDVDKVFGSAPESPTGAGGAVRSAGLQADVDELLKMAQLAPTPAPPAAVAAVPAAAATEAPAVESMAVPAGDADAAPTEEAPVRDLVQVFFEGRGFQPAPAPASARPIELVLQHRSEPLRGYAFVPLAEPPSMSALRSIGERARDLGQKRLLIAVEGALHSGEAAQLPAHGVRVLDRAAIESQLDRLDAGTAGRIRARARQLAGQRLRAA